MKEHPDKHIREAMRYAEARGWVFTFGGNSSHCYGRLKCGNPGHREHMMSIWCTPKNPQNHAYQIIRKVDSCSPLEDSSWGLLQ